MTDHQLVRKLIWIVFLKLTLLFGLWWFFVHDQQVTVSSESIANAIQPQENQPATGESRNGH